MDDKKIIVKHMIEKKKKEKTAYISRFYLGNYWEFIGKLLGNL